MSNSDEREGITIIKTIVVRASSVAKMQEKLDDSLAGISSEELIDIKLSGAENSNGNATFMAIIIYEENVLR